VDFILMEKMLETAGYNTCSIITQPLYDVEKV
jgi:hypothetical protein